MLKINFSKIPRIIINIILGIFLQHQAYGQTLIIKDFNSKDIIPYAQVLIDDKIISSNYEGKIFLRGVKSESKLTIKNLGYKDLNLKIPKKDTTIFLEYNVITLGEVIVNNSDEQFSIIGNYKKRTINTFVNHNSSFDNEFMVVNKTNTHDQITALYFYVTKENAYKNSEQIGPIEIVFFNENNKGLPSDNNPINSIVVSKYKIGWNKIKFDPIRFNANFFYGIRWIYDSKDYHYKEYYRKEIYNYYGPKLGGFTNIDVSHTTYCHSKKRGWYVMPNNNAMLALEINK